MLHFRRSARVDVPGVSLTVEAPAGDSVRHRVRNLSEGGMLVEGLELPVAQDLVLTVDAPELHATARGHVAHRTGRDTGIAVDRWNVPIEDVRALLDPQFDTGELYVAEWA